VSIRRPTTPRIEPDPAFLAKLRERGTTRAMNVQATMWHHRNLFRALGGLYEAVLVTATTPRRQRELVILRTGWNCQAEYEFGQHTLMGRDAGLTDAEIWAVTRPLSTTAWADDDRVLLQMADDLYADDMVTDETWAELSARWSVSEVFELICTSLSYRVVSGILNSTGVQLDDGVPGWPSPPDPPV
jgi:4-carboxymuconolactone decarboxylase